MSLRFNKWDAMRVYLLLSGATSFFFMLVFTVNMIYHVQTVGLNPLQLVLVGTLLEIICLTFEIPTGVVADVYSRRLSILIGLALIGTGFIIEGSIPLYEGILLSQIFWGIGATFMSGATEAWITDEVGEENAGQAFLRGSRVGSIAGMLGTGTAIVLGSIALNLPIVLGGVLFIALALLFTLVMPENGFKPAPKEDRETWRGMFNTLGKGVALVRVRPILITILLISAVFGMFTEGLDRLNTAHLLTSFTLPDLGGLQPVVWLGLLGAAGSLMSFVFNGFLQRWVDTSDSLAVSRALRILYALLILFVVWFALANSLLMAIVAVTLAYTMRSGSGPLESAWTNLHVDSEVRATVLSIRSQFNAFGQIIGGPAVGYVALNVSIRVALSISALLLTPALLLFARSNGKIVAAAAAEAVGD
jgi:MFS transporter, DHA3 family, tetracycline resistance protein